MKRRDERLKRVRDISEIGGRRVCELITELIRGSRFSRLGCLNQLRHFGDQLGIIRISGQETFSRYANWCSDI